MSSPTIKPQYFCQINLFHIIEYHLLHHYKISIFQKLNYSEKSNAISENIISNIKYKFYIFQKDFVSETIS